MKTLSIKDQLELISPEKINLTEDELRVLRNEVKLYNDTKDTEFKVFIHYIKGSYIDLLDKAKSFADMIGHDNNDDNLLVWFYDLYQAQQAQKQI